MSFGNIRLTPSGVLWIAVAALLLPVGFIEYRVLQVTHGILAYPLDDAFIHMTVSRNLALNHVWGITKDSFQSASSSPLYTVLLAGVFKIFGVHIILPLLINIVAGVGVLWVAQRWLIRQGVSPAGQLIILLLLNFLTPLPLLVISGMEHTLQLLFCILFIFSFADAIGRPPLPWPVYLYGALMVTTRYECLIILGLVCLVLLFRGQWRTAFSLGAVSVLPIVAFGLFALSKGSFFLPNSVVLKSALPHSLHGLLRYAKEDIWSRMFFSLPPALHDYNILAAQRLLLLLPLCYLVFLPQVRRRADYRYILIVLMGAVLAHIAFAFPANFPRYEDYLIGCSVLIVGVLVRGRARARPILEADALWSGLASGSDAARLPVRGTAWLPREGATWVAAGLGVVLLFPLLIRSEKTFQNSKWYCVNIFEQQYQMAQFVHRYYDSTGIAFNDIGAISFYSVGPKLDLFGLASLDVAKRRRANRFTAGWADSLGRQQQIKLAIVYDTWQDSALLHRWNKIASWQNHHNVVLGSDSVSFYTLDAADTTALRKNLEAFQPSLPADVTVRYY
jgi:hypothetical protein